MGEAQKRKFLQKTRKVFKRFAIRQNACFPRMQISPRNIQRCRTARLTPPTAEPPTAISRRNADYYEERSEKSVRFVEFWRK